LRRERKNSRALNCIFKNYIKKILLKIASRVVFVSAVKNMKIKHCSAAGNLLTLMPSSPKNYC